MSAVRTGHGAWSWGRRAAIIAALAAGAAAGSRGRQACSRADEPAASPVAEGQAAPPPQPLEFMRVHVPAGRLTDVPLGDGRYVPMSAREFEEGIVRLSAGRPAAMGQTLEPPVGPLATAARYVLTLAEDGSLAGNVSFDVGSAGGAGQITLPREMPLGTLDVRSGSMQTAAGLGAAVLYGRRDGSMAVATPEAGTYTCEFRRAAEPGVDGVPRFSLPLVPALSSSITLRLPRGIRPVFVGAAAARLLPPDADARTDADGASASPRAWRIDTGPRGMIDVALVADDRPAPALSVWTDMHVHGSQSSLDVRVQPRTAWLAGQLRLEKETDTRVTRVAVMGDGMPEVAAGWTVEDEGRTLVVELPAHCVGTRLPLLVTAVAPQSAPLPMMHAPAAVWAGGGIAIRVAPSLAVASVESSRCMVVSPEAAARWPLPDGAATSQHAGGHEPAMHSAGENGGWPGDDSAPGIWPARLFLEEQAPHATVTLALVPRTPSLDVARVTTVDLSPGVVVGRASCAIRVQRGEAFDLAARITPGWFIDAVEAIAPPTAGEPADAARRRDAAEQAGGLGPASTIDWRVQRDARGDMLRVGLTVAATPVRSLGLRIVGHRAGVALGTEFSTAEMDMVRFDGETERSALIELRTSPETTVDFSGAEQPAAVPDGRLALLVDEGAVRARVWGGHRAASRMGRLVRRRPPLDARTQVRLMVRDDRLTESFTFECQPAASDLDSIVVQFSEPIDDVLEWSLLPPAVGTVSARRLDAPDRRGAPKGAAAGGDRWLVELNPAARGPVTIRAARTMPFTRPTPVPLAWVDGAISDVGQVIVRDVGRTRPQMINRRLDELPPDPAATGNASAAVAEFSFDPTAAGGEMPAAELLPGGSEARAWAWREITSTWCHTSGATEYETFFEIENHGRGALALSLPAGRRVQGVLLDGTRVPLGELAASGGEVMVDLPAGRRMVTLLVRTVAESTGSAGLAADLLPAWRINPGAVAIDAPVLHREWRLLLPPELEIAWVESAVRLAGGSAGDSRDWAARLLAAGLRSATAAERGARAAGGAMLPGATAPDDPLMQGFRTAVLVPSGNTAATAGVVVVRGRTLAAATLFVGLLVACCTIVVARASAWAALVICLLAGVAALWIATPFDGIARAAWWAAVAAMSLSWTARSRRSDGRRRPGRASIASTLVVFACSLATPIATAQENPGSATAAADARPPQADGGPLRVFITPLAGNRTAAGTALVPESLFRLLVRGEESRAAAVRLLSARVVVPVGEGDGGWAAWRLAIDVDADAGGTLVLDQAGSGGRFRADPPRIEGGVVRVGADRSSASITFQESGRHSVSLEIEPVVQRRGDVETATIAVPVTPATAVELAPTPAALGVASGIACEAAQTAGVFVAAPRRTVGPNGIVYDVSRAMQVRLVRPSVPGSAIAQRPRKVASRNDILWNLDECRLTAAFEIEAADGVVRSAVVQADAGLQWIALPGQPEVGAAEQEGAPAGSGFTVRPLAGGRFLVERRLPERGRWRFEMAFRMPLADPVGVFDVPGAWLEHAGVDERTVRLVASPSLAVRIDLPAGLAPAAIPEVNASFETRSWSGVVNRSPGSTTEQATVASAGDGGPRARLTAERRRQEIRGTQREAVVFAADQVRLHLDARIDAPSMAVVTIPVEVPQACVIDRIELFEDDVLHPETAERGAIDIRWTRTAENGVAVVVQRPRAGRFRLEVDARLPGRPAVRGPLPSLRVAFADGGRVVVDLQAEDGQWATVDGSAATAGGRNGVAHIELPAGAAPPTYRLETSVPETPSATAEEDRTEPNEAVDAVAESDGEGRIELADIRVAVDERGRTWGLACFELVAAEQLLRVRLPQSWRLFDVLVDGRSADSVVPVVPEDDHVWEVRLLDAGWPRSVVVLFAGDLGRRLLDGEPLELAPPAIVGLPCRQVIWTMQVPAGISLRVAEPARLVTAVEWQQERRVAQQRLVGDFQRAIDHASGVEQGRLRGFLQARGDAAASAADEPWTRTLMMQSASRPAAPPLAIVTSGQGEEGGGRITIRAVRQRDPSVPGRAVATLSLLACAGLAWIAGRRGVPRWLAVDAWLGPAIAVLLGLAWLVWLVPAWPGVILVAVAGWRLLQPWLRNARTAAGPRPPAPAANVAEATTMYRPPPAEGSTTHVAPKDTPPS